MTYSIVALDQASGQLGVAVQSHWFAVGTVVPWAEAGVGAVATQALGEPGYGHRGLELLRSGVGATDALAQLVAADDQNAARQVGMVDATGGVAAHTGTRCIAEAGHISAAADGFTVQANMMARPTVWGAMAGAYQAAGGDLVDRLLAALDAAEAEGGDIRGRQSAALLVVAGEPTGRAGTDRLCDLRVDDHPDPLAELRRLARLRRGYLHMADGTLSSYREAARLMPGNPETVFWRGLMLAEAGRDDEALGLLGPLFAEQPQWRDLLYRISAAGLSTADDATVERIANT